MATHSSILAWRIPGTGEPGGLPSMGLYRVGHDWSDLAAAARALYTEFWLSVEISWHKPDTKIGLLYIFCVLEDFPKKIIHQIKLLYKPAVHFKNKSPSNITKWQWPTGIRAAWVKQHLPCWRLAYFSLVFEIIWSRADQRFCVFWRVSQKTTGKLQ